MIMVHGKLRHRRTWKAGAVTACAAVLLSLGLLPAAAQAGTRATASQRAEGVRVIGHKVIDGKTYKVIYVAGASPARTKPKVTQAAVPSTIVNDHSGKCAEVYHSQTSNGANVDQWSCNGTATQTWNFELVGVDTYGNPVGLIKNANSGKCFEVYNWGAGNGSNVDQWTCAPQDHSNQLWDLDGPFLVAVGASDYRNLVVVAEVNGWSTANKGNVDIWQSYADSNQMWKYNFGG
jgi:ricin-type beta-trefoil lectin protein